MYYSTNIRVGVQPDSVKAASCCNKGSSVHMAR